MNPVHSIFGFRMRLNWGEIHHLYYGLVLMVVALFMSSIYMAIPVFIIGALLSIDDLYQHHRQVDEPWYHSPVHNWYADTMYKYPVIRKINAWADKMMNRK